MAVKILALVRESNGLAVRPSDIRQEIAENLFSNFESEVSDSSIVSVKGEDLTVINTQETKVIRKTEAFICPMSIQVSFTDMESVQAAFTAAFTASFPGTHTLSIYFYSVDI